MVETREADRKIKNIMRDDEIAERTPVNLGTIAIYVVGHKGDNKPDKSCSWFSSRILFFQQRRILETGMNKSV